MQRVLPFAERLAQATRVASNRQLKRRRGHPATWAKKGFTPKPAQQPEPLKWEPSTVEVPAHGWLASSGSTPADIPFRVMRTDKGKQLPVYTDFKNGRSRVVTSVRKVAGDVQVAQQELQKVCQGAETTLHAGRIEIKGLWTGPVRRYLYGLGF